MKSALFQEGKCLTFKRACCSSKSRKIIPLPWWPLSKLQTSNMILEEYKHLLDFPVLIEKSLFRWWRKLGFCNKPRKKDVILSRIWFDVDILPPQSCTKYCRRIHEMSKIGFSMDCFTAYFSQFSWLLSKFALWVACWVLGIYFQHFMEFLEVSWFPEIFSLK